MHNYCGLSFCIYQDRCSIYADPYHFCSYHGLETDLLNLTACWGYEVWRVSTTYTLVIESVKATSVIFLLGVGSFVCYKLYNHYRKKFGGGSSGGKRLRLLKWASQELLDSSTDLDSDLQNIETKYFGPDEITNDDAGSECTDNISNSSSSLDFAPEEDETASDVTDSGPEMGNLHCQYEPVLYSPHTGVNFTDNLLTGQESPSTPCSATKSFHIPPRPGYPHNPRRKSRRFDLSSLIAKHVQKDGAVGGIGSPSAQVTELKEDYPLLFHDEDKSVYYGPSRHSSEADIESLGSPSATFFDNYLDDFEDEEDSSAWGQDGASLKANCSPRSLAERANILHRLPPDGADSMQSPEDESKDFTIDDDPLKEPLTFRDDDLGLDTDSDVFTSSEGKVGRLVRDHSIDSDVSEFSLDVSLRDDIGSLTVARVDHLLSHVHQIKQSCHNLDAHIVSLKVDKHPPSNIALAFPLSDSSHENSLSHSSSALDLVAKHKSRVSSKGLLETKGVAQFGDKSTELSAAEHTSNSSGALGAELSMEWDSPVPSKGNKKLKVQNGSVSHIPVLAGGANGSGVVDSGSDFGTPLTSESPDCALRTESVASLEWDEEFSAADADDVDDLKLGDNIRSLVSSAQLERLINDPRTRQLVVDEETLLEGSISLSTKLEELTNDLLCTFQDRVVPGQSRDCSPCDAPVHFLSTSAETVKSLPVLSEMACLQNKSPTEDGNTEITGDTSPDGVNLDVPPLSYGVSSESGFDDDGAEGNSSAAQQPVANIPEEKPKLETKRRRPKKRRSENKANRDSAYCEGTELNVSRVQENIGEKWDLIQYCEMEWRGQTQRAETIRKGYADIPSRLGCFHLRRIRGDNYCAIRAALFQTLVLGVPILDNYGGLAIVIEKLEYWMKCEYPSFESWSFANRLPYSKDTCLEGFRDCLHSLDQLTSKCIKLANREEFVVDQLNSDPDLDVRLMEAVKLLMLVASTELFEAASTGADSPVFSMLLFARDTSENPHKFMMNHLNLTGDSGGLEQIEMFLLGYTLGVTLQVVRPSSFGSDVYICFYPDDNVGVWPEVNLIAEDDRHYNIILN